MRGQDRACHELMSHHDLGSSEINWLQVEVHGTGRLMMFCSRAPCKCILDSKEIEYEYDNEASKLMVTLAYARGLNHNLVVVL